ncbi:unnamed protein product, partial [Amoebophrya sp. A25]
TKLESEKWYTDILRQWNYSSTKSSTGGGKKNAGHSHRWTRMEERDIDELDDIEEYTDLLYGGSGSSSTSKNKKNELRGTKEDQERC